MIRKKKLRRWVALLLCIFMLTPSQGLTALAEATEETEQISISETLPLEIIEETEDALPRIEETIALELIKEDKPDEWVIYWNPGGGLPQELASASNVGEATPANAGKATASNAPKGNDNADGRTPSTPVKTLAKALARVEELIAEEDILPVDITIYAMNPMEIGEGQLYALNGGNLNIESWPGRSYESDVIFYVNGGQLTMMNVQLASGNPEHDAEETRLVYVRGGAFQMGSSINLEGRVVMDYRSETVEMEWEREWDKATASDAAVSFDLNEYILSSDEDSIELIEDYVLTSTWQEPIIELLEGFDDSGEYLLELLTDGSGEEIPLVKTLYSDVESGEKYLGFFTLVDNGDISWSLQVETQATALVRRTRSISDNPMGSVPLTAETMTRKILVASRAAVEKVVYWNPGGDIEINGTIYYAGNDDNFSGSNIQFPVKSWKKAVAYAEGGTVICMQTLDLGDSNAGDYLLTKDDEGNYLLKSSSLETRVALSAWSVNPQAIIRVPAGQQLTLQDIELIGAEGTAAQAIVCDKGDIIIGENVIAEKGYIQITAFYGMEAHPVKVTSGDAGIITLFFSGINNNYDYCYTDVVIPWGGLADSITSAENAEAAATQAQAVGLALLNRFRLHASHRDEVNGGVSKFDWILRQDTVEDDGTATVQNLELYATHYYDAIYLNGVKGNDDYYGATCQFPLKTWARTRERWAHEMVKSVEARWAAAEAGKSAAYIEEFYPMPKTIYICETVTVTDSQTWDLWSQYQSLSPKYLVDYDGSTIMTEVVAHMDIPHQEDSTDLIHEIPETLAVVTNGGDLTIKDVTFRNITDDTDSVTIQVEGSGKLTLKGKTLLTGERLDGGSIKAKKVTLGTHVKVLAGGTFEMDETWSGAIEKRQHGVKGAGAGTTIVMNGGSIRENNSFEQEIFDAKQANHKDGAGVLLSDKAKFTMNGGKITGNTVYQHGAGVYMIDEGTSFVMNKGEISGNKINSPVLYKGSSNAVRGRGVGIYAATGTKLILGNGVNPASGVRITNNVGYLTEGVGVWSDGELSINQAAISDNYTREFTGSYTSYGIGIHLAANGLIDINDAQITGNYTSATRYGSAQGAGIYFASTTKTRKITITGSTISGNKIGYEYSNSASYSAGGGIYMAGSNLDLTIVDSVISENQAYMGGGIYINSSLSSTAVELEKTTIEKNKAVGVNYLNLGVGGGIYFYGNGSLILQKGVKIIENTAQQQGGGIYRMGTSNNLSHIYMRSDEPNGIQINGNEGADGGGIFHRTSTIHAENIEINGNKATSGGGIYADANSHGYFRDVEIVGNQGTKGGGLYTNNTYYINDCNIADNQALDAGGGMYISSGTVHFTEDSLGAFKLKGNRAANGGGLYVNSGSFYMNIAGEIQNSAREQGSNLYLVAGKSYILSGHFKQPKATDQIDGVYNIYVNDTTTTGGQRYLNMSEVTVEKKDESNPEVIYLNTANSYLTFLSSPPDDTLKTFPIDLNKEVFKAGSVVVRPINKDTVVMYRPNSALAAAASAGSYSYNLQDASENLNYVSGGKLPRRTWLGGFKVTPILTNVTLVAEGIYLSGTGNDEASGASPDQAVRTFKVAKEKLERIITETAAADALQPPDERMGFSPFIYICGQVDITSGEPRWELNYDDTLFTKTNENYINAEELIKETAYPAQVRRFASFVSAPMIKAGDGVSPVEFSTGKIIINGMAGAVITNDQGQNSPVIYGDQNTKVTLNKESQIENNYYNGLDIYGELVLKGEAGDLDSYNKQLYNHHGAFVRLFKSSKMYMEGGARILADSDTKTGAQAGIGIYIMGEDVSVFMSGDSGIEQVEGSSLLSKGGIYSSGNWKNTSLKMSDTASISSDAMSMEYAVYLRGENSDLVMEVDSLITLSGTSEQRGIYLDTPGAGRILMKDKATISITTMANNNTTGIAVAGSKNMVVMEGKSKINVKGDSSRGITLGGTGNTVIMQGGSLIKNVGTTGSAYYGIQMTGIDATIEMLNNATISGSDVGNSGTGIYVNATNAKVLMNMDSGVDDEDSAKIINTNVGNYIISTAGYSLSMGKNAVISNANYGVHFVSGSSEGSEYQLLMEGNSKICDSIYYGVYMAYGKISIPVNIQMKEYAAIEQNRVGGICENPYSTSTGTSKFHLEMDDQSRISGNGGYGVYLAGYLPFTEATGYHKVTLKGEAVIGGNNFYDADNEKSGNLNTGIYANSPLQLTMNDTSKISGNGNSDKNTDSTTNGVYLTRWALTEYYRSGTAKITLNDSASICDNRGGVYTSSLYANFPNSCVIELNGIKKDGSLSDPSICRNTDAVLLGSEGTLQMKGGARLGVGTEPSSVGSLDCYGDLELDGRSTVEGLLYMRNGERPITMTHKVVESSLQEYQLYLVEGFLGQIVVRPDGDTVTDVTDQITYFKKVGADGMAADKNIIADAPNLVLLGENNVYLSGAGDDNNSGNSKSTPVRTFWRAKELLEGGEKGGYYTSGANIIVCTSTVYVLTDDDDWSFDEGGYVKNEKSEDRWKPLIIRDESYTGILIAVSSGVNFAKSVTFKNITIDGGSEEGLTTSLSSQLITVYNNMTAILKDGAVLQNNKGIYTSNITGVNTLGVYVIGGTLEIDGGTIQNMVRERSGTSNVTSPHYMSSAIWCVGSAGSPGKVIMKSGQIISNQVLGESLSSFNNRCGTIYLNGVYASMEISGGQIVDNTIRLKGAAAAGAIINYQSALTISGGTIRDNQGGYGSAVYHYGSSTGGKLIFSGGKVYGNKVDRTDQSVEPQGVNSPIYIAFYGMELKGGAAELQDSIYLASSDGIIKVSEQMVQENRQYRVYLKQGSAANLFKKGSVVVQPDGTNVTDATPYLSYFDVRTSPYVLDRGRVNQVAGVNQSAVMVGGVKENQCLLLMKAVYLDSVKGIDSRDGLTPAKAVKTFAIAKVRGGASDSSYGTVDSHNHYIIYVSGKATNTVAEHWSLPEFAYMCRYTGFPVYYNSIGVVDPEENLAYHGSLIEPSFDLVLEDITIYGRRPIDTVINNGESLVHVSSGTKVTVQAGTVLKDNYNIGSYIGKDGLENLSSKGGAFRVAPSGTLEMNDGVIQNTQAASGGAIYLEADEKDSTASGRGRLILDGTPEILGNVYLDGTASATAAFVEPMKSYRPTVVLQISIGNDYNKRPVIQYPAGVTPGADELEYYLFDDAIKAMYDIINRPGDENILELNMRKVFYLDGRNDNDEKDGLTPATAFNTLKQVFDAIGEDEDNYGIVVFVVNTVEVSGANGPAEIELMNIRMKDINGNNHYEGYYQDSNKEKINIRGQVYFKRYAQPKGYTDENPEYEKFGAQTLTETLFEVKKDGLLTLRGIYLDGHAQAVDNSNPMLVADGVTAMSPLVTVETGGTLECLLADGVINGISTATLFTNNINENQKSKKIGELNGSDVMEGSSAGIELLDGGEGRLQYTKFTNLQLGKQVVAGGTDVYNNGKLRVSLFTHFSGTVYLEGLATSDNGRQDTSRYIDVEVYGDPLKTDFQVLMRDPYMGRTVVYYPDMTATTNVEPPMTDIGYYRLEERVKDYFCLNKRSEARYIFELQVPAAVYIDGIKGDDGTDLDDAIGRVAGSTPKTPVKSLKRAVELLSTRGGNTIYVVGTIQISNSTQMTGRSYQGSDGSVLLGSTDKVRFTRYIQPDFAVASQPEAEAAGYDVPDFTGVLLNVKDGSIAWFGDGIYFDGHSEPKENTNIGEYAREAIVSRTSEAKAPLITVESGATLNLLAETTLLDNNNTYKAGEDNGQEGGAIANSGAVNVTGALFANNKAEKGSVVYQNGVFNIQSHPENLKNHDNTFYLTTANERNHVIRTAVAIPADIMFDVDMDNAVKGRPVVQFTDSSAYDPDADAEHVHFKPGSTVPAQLFLVESEMDPELLELQNWEILKIEVPTSMYLIMSRKGEIDTNEKLRGIMTDAPVGSLLSAPEYKIENKGNYDAKVSISSFENQTKTVGIDIIEYPLMTLTDKAIDALGSTDLYLAVKGLDNPAAAGTGFGIKETSLKPYEAEDEEVDPALLGILTSGTSGNFTFIGSVGSGFMNQYLDPGFLIDGFTGKEAQAHMDGTSDTGIINARAKYLLRYKVEIDPSRR